MMQFSTHLYEEILSILKSSYTLVPVSEIFAYNGNERSTGKCILRHDIDYSLDHALNLARLENAIGIQATFYFLLDSNWYNLFNAFEEEKLNEILGLGHDIGLHFNADNCAKKNKKWQEVLQWHKSILENISGKEVHSFSYHNPGAVGLETLDRSNIISGMVNCYASDLNENFDYCSDSLGQFKDSRFFSSLRSGAYKNLHLLIHPIWWQQDTKGLDLAINENIQNYHKKLLHEWKGIKKVYNVL